MHNQINTYKQVIVPYILAIILIALVSIQFSYGQKRMNVEVCENCLIKVFNETFKATKVALPPSANDSATFTITIPAKANEERALLYLSDADYIEVFDGNQIYFAGRFTPKTKLSSPFARYLIPIKLGSSPRELSVRIVQNDQLPFTIIPRLILGNEIEDVTPLYYSQNEPARMVNLISIVLLSLLLVYSIYQSVLLSSKIYKAYGFYLLSVLIFLLLFTDEYLQWHILLPQNLDHYGAYNIFPQGLIYVIYSEFGMAFLDIKKKYPRIFKITRLFQILILLITGFHSLFLIFSGGDQSFIYKYFLLLYAVILLISNYLTYLIIFKIKDQTKWFLIIGSLTIGWAVGYEVYNVFVNGSPKPRDFFYTLPSGFMHFSFVELSYVIESLIFLMGINFKNLRKEKENKALKERVIEQLKEKESLEKQVNQLLKDKLKSSEEQLQTELINSEYERNKVQLLQSQLSSLQLQMNPHYLFNSLNSINDFIISKKPEEASEYLALYARMMRSILRNSDQTFNSLAQELQFCKDYLELEALRFEDRFKYQIIEPSKTSFLDKNIPGMMLQPILENAVWHGIMPKKGEGIIVLDCSQTTLHRIIIEISDNGSGLKTSDSAKMKESYGLKNIKEKITLIQKLYSINIEFEIMNNPESSGVMVRFVFPEIENINLTQ